MKIIHFDVIFDGVVDLNFLFDQEFIFSSTSFCCSILFGLTLNGSFCIFYSSNVLFNYPAQKLIKLINFEKFDEIINLCD